MDKTKAEDVEVEITDNKNLSVEQKEEIVDETAEYIVRVLEALPKDKTDYYTQKLLGKRKTIDRIKICDELIQHFNLKIKMSKK